MTSTSSALAQESAAARAGNTTNDRNRDRSATVVTEPDFQPVSVTESLTVAVDAGVDLVRQALADLDFILPAIRTLDAVGLADHLALPPALLAASPAAIRLGLIWRIEGSSDRGRVEPRVFDSFRSPGHMKVSWEVEVKRSAVAGAYLRVSTLYEATDAASGARLLDGWRLV